MTATRDKKLHSLLNRYGYSVSGKMIISNAIRGFFSATIFGSCRSIFDACEQLIPIIRDDGFYSEFKSICEQS